MFDILQADIVVFQETKIQRKDLTDDMVLVPGWDCFFSLPRHKKGSLSDAKMAAVAQLLNEYRLLRCRHLHASIYLRPYTRGGGFDGSSLPSKLVDILLGSLAGATDWRLPYAGATFTLYC